MIIMFMTLHQKWAWFMAHYVRNRDIIKTIAHVFTPGSRSHGITSVNVINTLIIF